MINFFYQIKEFRLCDENIITKWINDIAKKEEKNIGEINYIFCNDEDLLKINLKYLNHDYYTDIISFDYSSENILSGDIFISIDRVKENMNTFNQSFNRELFRVISHGILHFIGYKDKEPKEKKLMREKEDFYIASEIISTYL
ncbi:rRNA maturation RNase YbeY [Ichthyobacterium seriolicida]|uniref:Endoribonuclease YbeY n=1 Tax=Ichthyobacterium seriolicida TaxID=242600 RepID=A0A1J1DX30_9FLAO|nr:rRNA maturation RNase YbeY [Ichthyobacterium seriolicida]BAV94415.1 rRNA maturation factor [Ichthyobacterium seriolicida]